MLFRSDAMEAGDAEAAALGLELARQAASSGAYDLVVLDELNVALAKNLVSIESVLGLIAGRHAATELVLSGRGARQEVLDAADLVTEMTCHKHYARQGVAAREGIEY